MSEIIIRIEPSKELSESLGFPYFIEKHVTVEEALESGLINEDELEQMKQGEICKSIKVE